MALGQASHRPGASLFTITANSFLSWLNQICCEAVLCYAHRTWLGVGCWLSALWLSSLLDFQAYPLDGYVHLRKRRCGYGHTVMYTLAHEGDDPLPHFGLCWLALIQQFLDIRIKPRTIPNTQCWEKAVESHEKEGTVLCQGITPDIFNSLL